MLSSQRLWPSSCSFAVAFMALLPVAFPVSASHAEHVAGRLGDLVRAEAELVLQILERGRAAEGVHADPLSGRADVAIPAERRGLLDRDARRHARRQHLVAVGVVLAVEQLPAGQADDARAE